MELEQYLERDILAFLDSKMQHRGNASVDREEEYGLYLTKDYLKELNYALDNDELTKAKKLFDELKNNHSKLPKKSIERKKIYLLLEKMYEKIQDYVKIKEGKIEVIKQGNSEIQKDRTDKFSELKLKDNNFGEEYQTTNNTTTTELPIGAKNTNKTVKKDNTKNEDKDKIQIDSNNTKSYLKETSTNKYYEEQSEISIEPEILTQNVFTKSNVKSDTLDNENLEILGLKNLKKINKAYFNNESIELNYLENELIENTIYLEQLKTKIMEKLISALNQKMTEKSFEQDKKIENIKKDIMKNIILELDKRFGEENTELIKNLKGEILNQTYRQVKNIITNKDQTKNTTISQNNTIHDITPPTITALSNESIIIQTNSSVESDNSKKELTPQILETITESNSQKLYEQAKQSMSNNQYENAINLLEKAIEISPKNRAAYIRLNECIEKVSKTTETSKDNNKSKEKIKYALKNKIDNKNTSISNNNDENNSTNQLLNTTKNISDDNTQLNIDLESVTKIESAPIESDSNNKILNLQNKRVEKHHTQLKTKEKHTPYIIHKDENKKIQQMYKEATYIMFQNKHSEAAKLFQEILRIRPENKTCR